MKNLLLSLILFTSYSCIAKTQLITPSFSAKKTIALDEKFREQFPGKSTQGRTIEQSLEDLFNTASEYINNNDLTNALEMYDTIIKQYPSCSQAYLNKGVVLAEQLKHEEALVAFDLALKINPDYLKATLFTAQSYKALNNSDMAMIFYEKALQLDPNLLEAHKELSRILTEQERFNDAIDHLQAAIRLEPNNMHLLFELANLYNMVNKTHEALEIYYALLVKSPESSSLLYNIGYTLKKLGKINEALPFYQATLQKNPNHAEAQFSLGLLYLSMGDFDKGWPLYEWRWKRDVQLTPRQLSKPQWDGSDLKGKTIFLHAEQGLGDTFQFIRYAKMIKEQYHGRVVVAVQDALFDIISLCPYIDQLTKLSNPVPFYDVHAPMLSLPHILKTTI